MYFILVDEQRPIYIATVHKRYRGTNLYCLSFTASPSTYFGYENKESQYQRNMSSYDSILIEVLGVV